MKQFLTGILALIILCNLSGCRQKNNDVSSLSTLETASESTESTNSTVVYQQPMISVAIPVVTETDKADDGTAVFHKTFQNISLIVPDPEVADSIILDFLNRTDMHDSTETIRKAAQAAFDSTSENWSPYLSQITFNPMRIDKGVLSMFGSYVSYDGAAHANTVYKSLSYDLSTGNSLSLSNILSDGADTNRICQMVLTALYAQKEDKQLYDGFEMTVKDRFNKESLINTDWFLSGTGLSFFFSPYEIGPYASGAVIAEIPYSQLTGILNDAYFPAERQRATGTVNAEIFQESALDRYTQFSEVVLEEGADKILLFTDALVYDVRVETGTMNGKQFTPSNTVLATYCLTPGDAIMIDSDFKDTLSTLRLSYTSNDKTMYYYIGINETNNTVTLTAS